MALETSILNDILDVISTDLWAVFLVSEAQSAITLGANISTLTTVANPTSLIIGWGSASSGAITTTNRPTAGTAINFSVKANLRGKTLVFTKSATGVIVATIDLTADIVAGTKGTGAFFNEIPITLTEV